MRRSLVFGLVAAVAALQSCSGSPPRPTTTPAPARLAADISPSPAGNGISGVTVFTFSALPNTTSATCSWDFGDGETGSGSVVTHVYAREGTFQVRLTVRGAGTEATASASVVVGTLNGTWTSLAVGGVWHELRVVQQGGKITGDWTVHIDPGSSWYTPGGPNLDKSALRGTVSSPRIVALSQSGECRRTITNGSVNGSLTEMGGGTATTECGGGASGFSGWLFYRQSSPTAPTSQLASAYTNAILDIMQNNSINRAKINWTDFRAQVIQRAQGAQTILDLYPAISLALGLLGDHHSFYSTASGTYVANPTGKQCPAPAVASPAIPTDIGYVRITGFGDTSPGADVAFADRIENQIRSQGARRLAGWVVDIRGNGGGTMWPMIAGVGSVLGEGVAGYFVPPLEMPWTAWGYRNGGAFNNDAEVIRTSAPYALNGPAPKVAVLTDYAVASSGEAVVVAFRARPRTRSFGSVTCGLSTSNEAFALSDGAKLFLTVAVMADRERTLYGDSIVPDESVSGDAEVVQRAIAWLRSGAQ